MRPLVVGLSPCAPPLLPAGRPLQEKGEEEEEGEPAKMHGEGVL